MLFANATSEDLSLNLPLHEIPSPPQGDFGAAFVKMFLSLIVLVILLYLTYWFLKHFINRRLQKGIGSQSIHILEKKMISAKTVLYLVEVEGKKVFLAESHLEVKRLESWPHE